MGCTNSLALNGGSLAVRDGLLSRLALLEKRLRDEDLLSSGGGPVGGTISAWPFRRIVKV